MARLATQKRRQEIQLSKKTLPLRHLQNKRVCIDLSCWMVQLQNVSKSHSCMKEKVYLRGLFHRLRALIAVNCTIVFVTGWMFHFELRYLSFWCKDCVQRYMPWRWWLYHLL
nr:flap endonuclease gen-like 2 [Quercus suber]